MPEELYQLTIERRDGYLYARLVTDETGLELMVGYGNELAAAVRESGCTKILFENYAPIDYDRAKYSLAANLFKNLVQRPVQVAIVDQRRNDKSYLGQATAAARAAGLNAKYFPSPEAAESWLAD